MQQRGLTLTTDIW